MRGLAEETTGISQFAFLSQAPEDYIPSHPLLHPSIESLSSLAICYGLRLCLNDAILENKLIGRKSEPLFSLLDRAVEKKVYSVTEAIVVGKFLAKHGFDIEKDLKGLEGHVSRMLGIRYARIIDWDPTACERT